MRIVFIGSGNLATHLSQALCKSGEDVVQVYSRTLDNAKLLADKLSSIGSDGSANAIPATDDVNAIIPDADAYIFSLKDDALPVVARQLNCTNPDAVFIHTAGSVSLNVFEGIATHYAVLYPMQTFSKQKDVDFSVIPCFIEGSDEFSLNVSRTLAAKVSNRIEMLTSEQRRRLHLAAVFACNMVNHCYRLAERELEKIGMDFSVMLPLVKETANKVSMLSPHDAQTGPMVRYDRTIMDAQLSLIEEERTKEIYKLIAESVHEDASS